MIKHRFAALCTLALFAMHPAPGASQQATDPHAGHAMTDATDSPATAAFKQASGQMHAAMAIPYTGNPDVDFIAGMIPHHQGAVDTARIVLQYGQDPEVRKFAQAVIDAQEAEIAWMQDWLARQGQ